MERSSFLHITLILMKRIQLTIPCFHERASSYFSCLKLHDFTPFKTKIFWGRTPWPPPPPRHINNIKLPCHLCVCVERAKTLYVDNRLESRSRLQKEKNHHTPPLFLPFSALFFSFFFCLSKISESWTPSDENSWIRAWDRVVNRMINVHQPFSYYSDSNSRCRSVSIKFLTICHPLNNYDRHPPGNQIRYQLWMIRRTRLMIGLTHLRRIIRNIFVFLPSISNTLKQTKVIFPLSLTPLHYPVFLLTFWSSTSPRCDQMGPPRRILLPLQS